jgi:transcriptional regulator with XRE-family HTH domain
MRTSITNIEKGRQKIQVHTLFDLAAALEVDPVTLIPSLKASETDIFRERVKGMRPDEREFVKSVLSSKSE